MISSGGPVLRRSDATPAARVPFNSRFFPSSTFPAGTHPVIACARWWWAGDFIQTKLVVPHLSNPPLRKRASAYELQSFKSPKSKNPGLHS